MISGSVIRSFVLVLIFACFVVPTARAAEVEKLMAAMAAVKHRVVSYKEEKQMEMLEESLHSEGRLEYIAPDKLIRSVMKPVEMRYIINSRQLIIDKGGKLQVRSLENLPLVRVFVESFRSVLAGDLDTLNKYYSITFSGDPPAWKLILQPKDKKLAVYVKKLELSGTGDDIQLYVVEDSNGDLTRMQLYPFDSKVNE